MPRVTWRYFLVKHWKRIALLLAAVVAIVLFVLDRLEFEQLVRLLTLLFGFA